MQLLFIFILSIAIIVPGTFNIAPGDPFPIDIGNHSKRFIKSNFKHISDKTFLSSRHLFSTKPKLPLINIYQNKHPNNSLFPSILQPVQETLPISKKHLIEIAQWKYTDPQTHEIRYWYHIAGSPMGSGWIFDGILCQVYSRQKSDTIPIRVYHSEADDIWTNTLQIESTPLPIGNNQWKYDGTPFYAYNTSMNSSLLKPIWRYWNRINYGTIDVSQPRRSYLRIGDRVDDDLPEWRLDQIVFYAFLPNMNVTE